ncbi:MAG: ribonuclease HII [Methylobacteriaceae bacterium]|nr:ribonuclease HII [Methylobacteriaceae bacterium]
MPGMSRIAGPTLARERALQRAGHGPVAGVDEVGRGPLAGPVVAAAVILDPARPIAGVDDSKALKAAQRDALFEAIMGEALAVAVASCSVAEIERLNIRGASLTAMARALAGLALAPAHALIDGRDRPPGWETRATAVIGGDGVCLSIAAASIVAKVTRDRMMAQLAQDHPAYGFDRHMGYATAAHRAAIRAHGLSPHHRAGFGLCAEFSLAL